MQKKLLLCFCTEGREDVCWGTIGRRMGTMFRLNASLSLLKYFLPLKVWNLSHPLEMMTQDDCYQYCCFFVVVVVVIVVVVLFCFVLVREIIAFNLHSTIQLTSHKIALYSLLCPSDYPLCWEQYHHHWLDTFWKDCFSCTTRWPECWGRVYDTEEALKDYTADSPLNRQQTEMAVLIISEEFFNFIFL